MAFTHSQAIVFARTEFEIGGDGISQWQTWVVAIGMLGLKLDTMTTSNQNLTNELKDLFTY